MRECSFIPVSYTHLHTADHSGYWSMQAQLHLVLEMHRHCPHARWSHPDRSLSLIHILADARNRTGFPATLQTERNPGSIS